MNYEENSDEPEKGAIEYTDETKIQSFEKRDEKDEIDERNEMRKRREEEQKDALSENQKNHFRQQNREGNKPKIISDQKHFNLYSLGLNPQGFKNENFVNLNEKLVLERLDR